MRAAEALQETPEFFDQADAGPDCIVPVSGSGEPAETDISRGGGVVVRGGLVVSGGVAANSELRGRFTAEAAARGLRVAFPSLAMSTDNAAMIAAAAWEVCDGRVCGG